ncbi:hypothetical protein Nepgr_005217 [Nepenthes gracilis]|uniref:Uncharacterized protein n=1 Tax=Nepenthes gracilis TaxID=150966 RepID=A0AAD3S2S7_NEPGR|nr:hypothetical protein Nepgr_005217 [Nepenthes gracilis]
MVQEAAATGPGEPEARGGERSSRSSFVTKAYTELEASKPLGKHVQSLQLKLVEIESHISTLKGQLKEKERLHIVLRGRNLLLEPELRTSLKPEDITPALECKYWDAINMCLWVMKLLIPRFPITLFAPRNSNAQCKNDLIDLPDRWRSSGSSQVGSSGQLEFAG